MASADPLHTLERCAITPLVRRAMHSPTVEVSEWSVNPIHSGDGEGLGVYRFFGTGEDRGQPVEWSVILKAFNKMRVPYPILLVLVFVKFLLQVKFDPHIVFLLFLPPLLYVSVIFTSWRDFRANLHPISLLAVGLVVMTT